MFWSDPSYSSMFYRYRAILLQYFSVLWIHIGFHAHLDPDPVLIRIQDVDDHKLYNFTVEKYPFFKSKIAIYLFISMLPCERRPRYKRSLRHSKDNIQNFKQNMKFLYFFPIFVCDFLPSAPDPADEKPIRIQNTDIFRNTRFGLTYNIQYMRDGDSLFPTFYPSGCDRLVYIYKKKCRRALLLHTVVDRLLRCLCRDISCFPQ
jgi:hypothetical protein